MRRMRPLAVLVLVLDIVSVAVSFSPARAADAPDIVETAGATLVQVDVSVLDPKSPSQASVRGLTAADFDVRVEGRRVGLEGPERLIVDEICEAAPAAPVMRPVLVVVDLNYIAAAGRGRVADALEKLAATPLPGLAFKFYAITNQVRPLADGFVGDAATIREVAARVRSSDYAGDRTVPPLHVLTLVGLRQIPDLTGMQVEADLVRGREAGVYEGEASLDALEGILRGHAGIPGRKVAVLFTSRTWGGRRADLMDRNMEPLRQLAQQGFAVWTVEAGGVNARGTADSQSYFGMVAKETGGEAVRGAVDLTSAFREAAERLSCYYLLSLPVARGADAGTISRRILVGLDATRRPELWKLQVRAPGRVTMLDARERVQRQRVAALVSPSDFDRPPVEAAVGFPVPSASADVLPVRFRVPLAGLTWLPDAASGGVAARLLFDASVERETESGIETVCRFGAEDGGAMTLTLPRAPAEDARAGLVVDLACPAKKDGLHTARGVVTDLAAARSGAVRATVAFRRGGAASWEASGLRVEASSGLDYVWRPGQASAKLDAARAAGRGVGPDAPATAADRLSFRYVLCGPDRAAVGSGVRHAVLSTGPDGAETTALAFAPGSVAFVGDGGAAPGGPFCAELRLGAAEGALPPGSYRFVVERAAGGRLLETPFAVR